MSLFVFTFQYQGQERENGYTDKLVSLSYGQSGAARRMLNYEHRQECTSKHTFDHSDYKQWISPDKSTDLQDSKDQCKGVDINLE